MLLVYVPLKKYVYYVKNKYFEQVFAISNQQSAKTSPPRPRPSTAGGKNRVLLYLFLFIMMS